MRGEVVQSMASSPVVASARRGHEAILSRRSRSRGRALAAVAAVLLAVLAADVPASVEGGYDRNRVDQVIDYTSAAPEEVVERYYDGRYVDYATPIEEDSPKYDRCKTTHRCPRAYNHFDSEAGTYLFTKRVFPNGLHQPGVLFNDFEAYEPGTTGWVVDENYLSRHPTVQHGAALFYPYQLDAHPLLYLNVSSKIVFDTDTAVATYTSIAGNNAPSPFIRDVSDPTLGTLSGEVVMTPSGLTEVAVFNFASLYLGPNCEVELTGNRAIAFTSRSALIMDTPLVAPPGEIGGFQGQLTPSENGNNDNGPGSGSLRVYLQTLTTHANDVDEVQRITTTAEEGQTLRGTYTLEYKGAITHPIPVDASPELLKTHIEDGLPLAGRVQVSRGLRDDEGGYYWDVTFASAPGDVPQMVAHSQLGSVLAHVEVQTLVDGNTIRGTFTMTFVGNTTRPVRAHATALEMQEALEELPEVITAHVVRNDPTGAHVCEAGECEGGFDGPTSWGMCEHGLCDNGPKVAWGYEYQLTITTTAGVVVPGSPTSPLFVQTTPATPLTADHSGLSGENASITVVLWQNTSRPNNLAAHGYSHASPFNLGFGGAGASYGGVGGLGHARHPSPPLYLDDTLPDLQGGSGGSVGGELPQQALAHDSPSGRGGDGGGAISIVAHTDIIIGQNGGINVDGEHAWPGYRGGGGGSGGAIRLTAAGVVVVHSTVSARGGRGGEGVGHGSRGGGGGGGGRVAMFGQSVTITPELGGRVDMRGGDGGSDGEVSGSHNSVLSLLGEEAFSGVARDTDAINGGEGTLRISAAGGAEYRVDLEVGGAADTQRCMRITLGEEVVTDSGVETTAPFAHNGPSFSLRAHNETGLWTVPRHFGEGDPPQEVSNGTRPELVTFYVRLGALGAGGANNNWGAHVVLHEFDEGTTSNLNPDGSVKADMSAYNLIEPGVEDTGGDASGLIGVAVIDGSWRYDANYRQIPGSRADDPTQHVFARNGVPNQWYKIDIVIDWDAKTYLVRLDDITRIRNVHFVGEAVRRIGLYTFHKSTVYFDEIYAGPLDFMRFECPDSVEGSRPVMERPFQHAWKPEDLGQETSNWEVVRHESHLSRRRTYNEGDFGGIVFYDGEPHRFYHSDILTKTKDGDRTFLRGNMHAGNLIYLPGDGPSDWALDVAQTLATPKNEWGARRADDTRGDPGLYFWFAEHDDPRWTIDNGWPSWYSGGVSACSTTDLITWRNEGIMFHFSNVSDDVLGRPDAMRVERPKTIYNNDTEKYVMWMHADNMTLGLQLAGVAQGGYVNGPYVMYHTLRPDGNETTDLTIFRDPDGTAHLARTYYASVPYYMPKPIMQPMWESVKFPDGTTDYALNYHRAFYHAAYDNPDDIYQQRWRFEDKEWRVETKVDNSDGEEELWVETYDAEEDLFVLENIDRLEAHDETNRERAALNMSLVELDVGFDPTLQSTGLYLNLTSVDPLECDPLTCTVMGYSSLPESRQEVLDAVLGRLASREILGQGQPPVQTRYKDPTNPDNNLWSPDSVPAVKAQRWGANYLDKNIADNPPHVTPQDILMGLPHIVEWRRTKYIAVSRLTDDFLDTNGELEVFEGELENELFLMAILNSYGRFEWRSGDFVRTTYPEDRYANQAPFNFDTASDWHDRLHQFYEDENDRADDFVNFRDKRTSFNDDLIDLCPRKHQTCQDKYATCQVIWAEQVLEPEVPQLSYLFEMKSYSIAQPTAEYETCLQEHRQCLEEYQHCVQAGGKNAIK